jgi:serine/threonine protein kinase
MSDHEIVVNERGDRAARDVSILSSGTVIDERYRLVRRLATGGMGEVYLAEHVQLGKAVALKVMLPDLSRDPMFAARFKREAIAASQIGQQNIVDVFDFGLTKDGNVYFVMEYLDGETLARVLVREGAMQLARLLPVALQIARALAATHTRDIIHRDLKPENVMLLQRPEQPDFVKVLDFGVAKVARAVGEEGHTAIGVVIGTPQYMAPEQARALGVDQRSDIYSLGLILYELIAGRPAFTAETSEALIANQLVDLPPPLEPGPVEGVPKELNELVFQMLEKNPSARPQTMEEVAKRLRGLEEKIKNGRAPRPGASSMATPSVATPATPASPVIHAPGLRAIDTLEADEGDGGPSAKEGPGRPLDAAERELARAGAADKDLSTGATQAVLDPVEGSSMASNAEATSPPVRAGAAESSLEGTAELDATAPRRSREPAALPLVLVLVVLVGISGLALRHLLSEPEPVPVPAEVYEARLEPISRLAGPVDRRPEQTTSEPLPAPKPPPPLPPSSGRVRLQVLSTPPNADVYADGVFVGRTPMKLSGDVGTTSSLKFVLTGYRTLVVPARFDVERDFPATLKVAPKPSHPSAKKGSSRSGPPATKGSAKPRSKREVKMTPLIPAGDRDDPKKSLK